jgi:hypothetical protein
MFINPSGDEIMDSLQATISQPSSFTTLRKYVFRKYSCETRNRPVRYRKAWIRKELV